MTIYFNVTDALGRDTNHGITRTERSLANQFVEEQRVEFVAMHGGRLHSVERHEVLRQLATKSVLTAKPNVERFGVDTARAPVAVSRRAVLKAARSSAPALPLAGLLRPSSADTIVSVGLDWAHRTVDDIERLHFAFGTRVVGFCYDLIPINHPEWVHPPNPEAFRAYLRRVIRYSSDVVCISHSTRADLMAHFQQLPPERCHTIRLGADGAAAPSAPHHSFARSLFDGEPFAVYCATIDRRKNHQVLYRAMRRLVDEGLPGNLVFVGKIGAGVADLVDTMRLDRRISGRIAHVTNCDDAHLSAIYQEAAFAVYPSRYEGWGLGVTEALAHGTTCLIASGSSLGEAGLGVCPEIHPLDTASWTQQIAAWFESPPPRPSVDLPTWSGAAGSLLEVCT